MKLQWINGVGWVNEEPIGIFLYEAKIGEVPANTFSNGISAPWFVWPFVDRQGKGLRAAIVHDYLYSDTPGKPYAMNRAIADTIFYQQLKHDGVNPIKAKLMYLAVRAFGKTFYQGLS